MRYWLYKIDDKFSGDSGGMSMTFAAEEGSLEQHDVKQNARPEVGKYIRVGSVFARTMQMQDWWQTNVIEEILEDTENYVKFRTKSGSIYEWKII